MGQPKMWSQHPKFLLLLVWCGVLSVAVVVIAAIQLTVQQNAKDLTTEDDNPRNPEARLASPNLTTGHHLSHVQLIMDSNLTWKYDLPPRLVASSRSLTLRNNSVYVTQGGLYYFYAHATFGQVSPGGNKEKRTITLIRNSTPQQPMELKLSEAVTWGDQESSVSVSKRISCKKGNSLRLEINPNNTLRLHNTHWGLFLLTPY